MSLIKTVLFLLKSAAENGFLSILDFASALPI